MPARPTRSRHSRRPARRGRPKATLSATVRCGNSAPSWNTIPIRRRSGSHPHTRRPPPGARRSRRVPASGHLETGDEPQQRGLPGAARARAARRARRPPTRRSAASTRGRPAERACVRSTASMAGAGMVEANLSLWSGQAGLPRPRPPGRTPECSRACSAVPGCSEWRSSRWSRCSWAVRSGVRQRRRLRSRRGRGSPADECSARHPRGEHRGDRLLAHARGLQRPLALRRRAGLQATSRAPPASSSSCAAAPAPSCSNGCSAKAPTPRPTSSSPPTWPTSGGPSRPGLLQAGHQPDARARRSPTRGATPPATGGRSATRLRVPVVSTERVARGGGHQLRPASATRGSRAASACGPATTSTTSRSSPT